MWKFMTDAEWIRKSLVGACCERCGMAWTEIPDVELARHWVGDCGE